MPSFFLYSINLYLFSKHNYIHNSYKKISPNLKAGMLSIISYRFYSSILAFNYIIFENNFIMKYLLSKSLNYIREEIIIASQQTLNGRRKWQPTPGFLPGESQGWRSLVGCCLWGRTESDTTEVTQQQKQQTLNECRLKLY